MGIDFRGEPKLVQIATYGGSVSPSYTCRRMSQCGHTDHRGFGKRITLCPECSPDLFCPDATHPRAKSGLPKARNSCRFCKPKRFCSDPTHRRGASKKKTVVKQACYDCCPARFCDLPGHPRGRNGDFRYKVQCWICTPEPFCFNEDHFTGFQIPRRKSRCSGCGNAPRKRTMPIGEEGRRRAKEWADRKQRKKRKRERKLAKHLESSPVKSKRQRTLDYKPISMADLGLYIDELPLPSAFESPKVLPFDPLPLDPLPIDLLFVLD